MRIVVVDQSGWSLFNIIWGFCLGVAFVLIIMETVCGVK